MLNKLSKALCSWGGRRPFSIVDPKHTCTKKGNPAPLWKNKSKKLFYIFFILNLLSAIFALIIYTVIVIYHKRNKQITCKQSLPFLKNEFNIIGFIILLINSVVSRFLSKINYASDEEWSRYTIINLLCWISLITYNCFDYYQFIKALKTKNKTQTQCKRLFVFTLWTHVSNMFVISIVAVFQLNTLLRNYCKLFIGKTILNDSRIPYTPAIELKVIKDF